MRVLCEAKVVYVEQDHCGMTRFLFWLWNIFCAVVASAIRITAFFVTLVLGTVGWLFLFDFAEKRLPRHGRR